MNSVLHRPRAIHIRVVAIALSLASGSVCASCVANDSAKDETVPGTVQFARRMKDGKQWTTDNLNLNTRLSYCYEDAELNCRRYGRLYMWASAQEGCHSLGTGWRLPTSDEWKQLAKRYGGMRDDSNDGGRAAFTTLLTGGSSGFDALLGGNRSADGNYERLEAHGFYWTASATDPGSAIFYNFGQGGQALNRQTQGDKQMAISVRCVTE